MNSKNYTETRLKKAGFLFVLKKLASYVWPIRLERYQKSGLEVVLYNGVTMLNSAKANYSYGNLQLAYTRFFREVELPWNAIHNVLVLGYGAGGVSALIHNRQPNANQIGVEYSTEVLDAYHRYFNPVANVRLECADAFQFVESCSERFDLVVVDIYEELDVPDKFQSEKFIGMLPGLLSPNGRVLFNKVVGTPVHREQLNQLMLCFSRHFGSVQTNEQLSLNHFILASSAKMT